MIEESHSSSSANRRMKRFACARITASSNAAARTVGIRRLGRSTARLTPSHARAMGLTRQCRTFSASAVTARTYPSLIHRFVASRDACGAVVIAPMLATLAEAPSPTRSWSTSRSATAFAPSQRCLRADGISVCGLDSATRRRSSSPRSLRRSPPGRDAHRTGRARRRTRGARCEGRAGRIPEAAGTHSDAGARLSSKAPWHSCFFDALRIGTRDLREQPLTARRGLEKLFARSRSPSFARQRAGDRRWRALYARASARDGRASSPSMPPRAPAKRSPDWLDQDSPGTGIRHRRMDRSREMRASTSDLAARRNATALARLVYAGNVGTGSTRRNWRASWPC